MPVELRKADRVSAYKKRWQQDSTQDTDAHRDARLGDYTELVNGETAHGTPPPSPPRTKAAS